ncbi:MAG TPA: hypothetical protein VIU62_14225 [Chloroflexota bacterium]
MAQPFRATTDLDHVLHIVVQAAHRRVDHLLSWGFSPEHPEVRDARIMFEMQQHVFKVHLQAQRTKRKPGAQPDS